MLLFTSWLGRRNNWTGRKRVHSAGDALSEHVPRSYDAMSFFLWKLSRAAWRVWRKEITCQLLASIEMALAHGGGSPGHVVGYLPFLDARKPRTWRREPRTTTRELPVTDGSRTVRGFLLLRWEIRGHLGTGYGLKVVRKVAATQWWTVLVIHRVCTLLLAYEGAISLVYVFIVLHFFLLVRHPRSRCEAIASIWH